MTNTEKLYEIRFSSSERIRKIGLWKVLCEDFLQRYINQNDVVVDLGAGHCEFINNISCKKKFAVDLSLSTKRHAAKNVRVFTTSTKHLLRIFKKDTIDVVFISNLLEHLDSKQEVFRLSNEIYEILKKGGRLLLMQPDIRLVGSQYWDFFDHKLPLTYACIKELLKSNNFTVTSTRYPFLPYSTKTAFLPLYPLLLKIYLRMRILHYLFGKQFFICARK